jgi:hypothetical protein
VSSVSSPSSSLPIHHRLTQRPWESRSGGNIHSLERRRLAAFVTSGRSFVNLFQNTTNRALFVLFFRRNRSSTLATNILYRCLNRVNQLFSVPIISCFAIDHGCLLSSHLLSYFCRLACDSYECFSFVRLFQSLSQFLCFAYSCSIRNVVQ